MPYPGYNRVFLEHLQSNEEIRKIAYSLWEEAGRPEGKDLHFWYTAENVYYLEYSSAPLTREACEEAAKGVKQLVKILEEISTTYYNKVSELQNKPVY